MIESILTILGFCLFVLIIAILFSRIIDGEWLWQTRKKKKKMDKDLKLWLKDKE